jgi:serine/threonine-protein phosphatase 2A regulatory subunit B
MNTSEDHNWKFAQCFGDKGESDDITEGKVDKEKETI